MDYNVVSRELLLYSRHNLSILKPFDGLYWWHKVRCNVVNQASEEYLNYIVWSQKSFYLGDDASNGKDVLLKIVQLTKVIYQNHLNSHNNMENIKLDNFLHGVLTWTHFPDSCPLKGIRRSFTIQRTNMCGFAALVVVNPNKLFNKQSSYLWFGSPWRWRHFVNGVFIINVENTFLYSIKILNMKGKNNVMLR